MEHKSRVPHDCAVKAPWQDRQALGLAPLSRDAEMVAAGWAAL